MVKAVFLFEKTTNIRTKSSQSQAKARTLWRLSLVTATPGSKGEGWVLRGTERWNRVCRLRSTWGVQCRLHMQLDRLGQEAQLQGTQRASDTWNVCAGAETLQQVETWKGVDFPFCCYFLIQIHLAKSSQLTVKLGTLYFLEMWSVVPWSEMQGHHSWKRKLSTTIPTLSSQAWL